MHLVNRKISDRKIKSAGSKGKLAALAGAVVAVLAIAGCAPADSAIPTPEKITEVVVVSHDSFVISDELLAQFTEETGYEALSLAPVTSFFVSPGYTDERMHLFVVEVDGEPGDAPDSALDAGDFPLDTTKH